MPKKVVRKVRKKVCVTCTESQPLSEFYRNKNMKDGHLRECRTCLTSKKRERYNGEAPFKKRIRTNYRLRRTGWTVERYDEVHEEQGGVCAICRRPCTSGTLAGDHDHKTNEPRGLLCRKCNPGLGFFEDNVEFLKSAIEYLERWGE